MQGELITMHAASTFRLPVAALLSIVALPASLASAQDFLLAPGSSASNISVVPGLPPANLGTFDIVIVPGAGLSGNAPALAAFNRAAAQWEAYISDSIIVTINADLANLGNASIIGSTSSVGLQTTYTSIRNAMVTDAANEADDAVVAFLPTAAQFQGTVSSGDGFNGNMAANKAVLKAMGFTGLDGTFGASDGSITFNSTFNFDFDNSNGVTAGMMDFETVAAHELGHALGFISEVDSADNTTNNTSLQPEPLDLFRFGSANNPATNAEFTTKPRNFVPGQSAIFDDLGTEYAFSTGVNGGDGRQASHWKDDGLTGNHIGVMDPTLALGQVFTVADSDLRALDVIGYEIAIVPEPSSLVLCVLAGTGLLRRRRSA
jgi:hypothetical protein